MCYRKQCGQDLRVARRRASGSATRNREIVQIIAVSRDVTARKEMEQALARSESDLTPRPWTRRVPDRGSEQRMVRLSR